MWSLSLRTSRFRTAAAVMAFAGSHGIMAQSSVSLYGVADDSLTYVSNRGGHSSIAMSSGGRGSSKWGFVGAEDLGGGVSAFFRMENGFDINNGQLGNNGRLYGRQAFVGLSSPYGIIQLGRTYDLIVTYLNPNAASVRFGGGLMSHAGDADNIYGTYAISNALKYETPIFAGTTFGVIYAPGGTAGSFAANSIYEVGVKGAQGNFSFAAAYSHVDNPAVTLWDSSASAAAGGSFSNPLSNRTYSGYASAKSYSVGAVSLGYSLGQASIGVIVSDTRYADVVPTVTTPLAGTHFLRNGEFNFLYQFTPTLFLGLGADYTRGGNAHYWQANSSVQYLLSKRTYVYAIAVYQRASGIDSTGKTAVANLYGQTASTSSNDVGVRVGVRHSF